MGKIELGLMISLSEEIEKKFEKVSNLDFSYCQLNCWDETLYKDKNADKIKKMCEKYDITITALWGGWPGPAFWNFTEGPVTLGLVPEVYQFKRMETLRKASDFAQKINVDKVVTHTGFIPENPHDSKYKKVVEAIRYVAQYCQNNDQDFLFETGQETPVTLLRVIEEIGLNNLAINLDPANLLMYGKANPVDALDVFGKYVKGVHAKDGEYPLSGDKLGPEKPLGEGRVDFPALISRLKELDYDGTLTIEREISGKKQIKDIKNGRKFLEKILKNSQ